MSNDDTLKLLKECNSGIQMAVFSIDEVLNNVKDTKLKKLLMDSKVEHEKLGDETHALIKEHGAEIKEPNPLAKGMSWIKTNSKIMMDDSDKVIVDLITDGCNMGIKSLYRYQNQYVAADHRATKLATEIIRIEEDLRHELREYL